MLALNTALALALSAPTAADSEPLARHFIEQLAGRHFSSAGDKFSDQMKSSLPPDKLQILWDGLENQKGAFKKIERVSSEPVGDGTAELVTCGFAKAPVTFEVYIDSQKHIGGFFLTPASIIARRFVNLLDKSDVVAAEAMFDGSMRKALPAPKLAALWKDLVAEAGKFEGLDRTTVEPASGDWAAIASARFEKKNVTLRVVVDGEARIIGFFRQ